MTDTWRFIVDHGEFSMPAVKRYGYNVGSVFCNRCCARDIPCCIGYDSYDLCLPCVQAICTTIHHVRQETLQAGIQARLIHQNVEPPPPYEHTLGS